MSKKQTFTVLGHCCWGLFCCCYRSITQPILTNRDMDGWVDGWEEGKEGAGTRRGLPGHLGARWETCCHRPLPPPRPLTAATRLFSVMKVRASNGSVSEARVATLSGRETSATPAPRARCLGRPPIRVTCTHAIFLSASARHTVLSWLTQATRLPLAEKQTPCTQPQLLLDSNISSPKGILEPHGVGAGRSSTSLM